MCLNHDQLSCSSKRDTRETDEVAMSVDVIPPVGFLGDKTRSQTEVNQTGVLFAIISLSPNRNESHSVC